MSQDNNQLFTSQPFQYNEQDLFDLGLPGGDNPNIFSGIGTDFPFNQAMGHDQFDIDNDIPDQAQQPYQDNEIQQAFQFQIDQYNQQPKGGQEAKPSREKKKPQRKQNPKEEVKQMPNQQQESMQGVPQQQIMQQQQQLQQQIQYQQMQQATLEQNSEVPDAAQDGKKKAKKKLTMKQVEKFIKELRNVESGAIQQTFKPWYNSGLSDQIVRVTPQAVNIEKINRNDEYNYKSQQDYGFYKNMLRQFEFEQTIKEQSFEECEEFPKKPKEIVENPNLNKGKQSAKKNQNKLQSQQLNHLESALSGSINSGTSVEKNNNKKRQKTKANPHTELLVDDSQPESRDQFEDRKTESDHPQKKSKQRMPPQSNHGSEQNHEKRQGMTSEERQRLEQIKREQFMQKPQKKVQVFQFQPDDPTKLIPKNIDGVKEKSPAQVQPPGQQQQQQKGMQSYMGDYQKQNPGYMLQMNESNLQVPDQDPNKTLFQKQIGQIINQKSAQQQQDSRSQGGATKELKSYQSQQTIGSGTILAASQPQSMNSSSYSQFNETSNTNDKIENMAVELHSLQSTERAISDKHSFSQKSAKYVNPVMMSGKYQNPSEDEIIQNNSSSIASRYGGPPSQLAMTANSMKNIRTPLVGQTNTFLVDDVDDEGDSESLGAEGTITGPQNLSIYSTQQAFVDMKNQQLRVPDPESVYKDPRQSMISPQQRPYVERQYSNGTLPLYAGQQPNQPPQYPQMQQDQYRQSGAPPIQTPSQSQFLLPFPLQQQQQQQHQQVPQNQYYPQQIPPSNMNPTQISSGQIPPGQMPPGQITSQNMGKNQIPPQVMTPQGMPPQGIPPQGMPPQGMAPQGMNPQQMGPQGMAQQQQYTQQQWAMYKQYQLQQMQKSQNYSQQSVSSLGNPGQIDSSQQKASSYDQNSNLGLGSSIGMMIPNDQQSNSQMVIGSPQGQTLEAFNANSSVSNNSSSVGGFASSPQTSIINKNLPISAQSSEVIIDPSASQQFNYYQPPMQTMPPGQSQKMNPQQMQQQQFKSTNLKSHQDPSQQMYPKNYDQQQYPPQQQAQNIHPKQQQQQQPGQQQQYMKMPPHQHQMMGNDPSMIYPPQYQQMMQQQQQQRGMQQHPQSLVQQQYVGNPSQQPLPQYYSKYMGPQQQQQQPQPHTQQPNNSSSLNYSQQDNNSSSRDDSQKNQ